MCGEKITHPKIPEGYTRGFCQTGLAKAPERALVSSEPRQLQFSKPLWSLSKAKSQSGLRLLSWTLLPRRIPGTTSGHLLNVKHRKTKYLPRADAQCNHMNHICWALDWTRHASAESRASLRPPKQCQGRDPARTPHLFGPTKNIWPWRAPLPAQLFHSSSRHSVIPRYLSVPCLWSANRGGSTRFARLAQRFWLFMLSASPPPWWSLFAPAVGVAFVCIATTPEHRA